MVPAPLQSVQNRRPPDVLPPAGRKGTFDGRQAVESAFALLLTKVTKHDRHIWRFKMKERRFIEEDN